MNSFFLFKMQLVTIYGIDKSSAGMGKFLYGWVDVKSVLWILQQKYQLVKKYLQYQEMEVEIYLSKHMMYIATNWRVLCIWFTQNNAFCRSGTGNVAWTGQLIKI